MLLFHMLPPLGTTSATRWPPSSSHFVVWSPLCATRFLGATSDRHSHVLLCGNARSWPSIPHSCSRFLLLRVLPLCRWYANKLETLGPQNARLRFRVGLGLGARLLYFPYLVISRVIPAMWLHLLPFSFGLAHALQSLCLHCRFVLLRCVWHKPRRCGSSLGPLGFFSYLFCVWLLCWPSGAEFSISLQRSWRTGAGKTWPCALRTT